MQEKRKEKVIALPGAGGYCQPMLKAEIKKWCMSNGKTFDEFATLCGVTRQTLSSWCSGRAVPRSRCVPRVAGVLGIGASELAQMFDIKASP